MIWAVLGVLLICMLLCIELWRRSMLDMIQSHDERVKAHHERMSADDKQIKERAGSNGKEVDQVA